MIDFERATLLHFLAACSQDAYLEIAPPCSMTLNGRGYISLSAFGSVIAVKGTADLADVEVDAQVLKDDFLGRYRVHSGFHEEFERIWNRVRRQTFTAPLYVTGHSLGGAIATLIGMALKVECGIPCHVVTFGSPRVGDQEFAAAYNTLVRETTRIVHARDIVPRVPKLGYAHVEGLLHVDDDGRILGPVRSLWKWLRELGEIALSDLNFNAVRDHHVMTYVHAMERLMERRKKEKGGDQ